MTAALAPSSYISSDQQTIGSGGTNGPTSTQSRSTTKYWKPLPFLTTPRQDASSVTFDLAKNSPAVVVVGGRNLRYSALKSVEMLEWNVQRRWWVLPDLQVARCGCATVVVTHKSVDRGSTVIQNQLYVVGGINQESQPQATMEVYTIGGGVKSDAEWTLLESKMSSPRMYPAAVSFLSSGTNEANILVLGGRDAEWQELDTCELFSVQTGLWENRLPMSTKRFGCGAVYLKSKHQVWAIGGYTGSEWTSTCEMYDINKDIWTEVPPMKRAMQFVTATLVGDSEEYIVVRGQVTEENSAIPTAMLQSYNITTQEWIILPAKSDTTGSAIASVEANRILSIGGAMGEDHEPTTICQFWMADFERLFGVLAAALVMAATSNASDRPPTTNINTGSSHLPASTVTTPEMQDETEYAEEDEETTVHPFLYPPPAVISSAGSVTSALSGGGQRRKVENHAIMDNFGVPVTYTGYLSSDSGRPHGKGRLTYNLTGDQYEGKFEMGARQGRGRMVYSNGDIFVGLFVDDKREGKGLYRYRDGRTYHGNYVYDLAEDERGMMKWKDGTYYEGSFYKSKRTGKGRITFPSGVVYEGDFVNGKYHGTGECRFADGSVYQGQWKHGKAHGMGKLTDSKGNTVHDGKWVNDSPVY